MKVKLLFIDQNISFPFLFDVYICMVRTQILMQVCVGGYSCTCVCMYSIDVMCHPLLLPTLFIKGLSLNLELNNF